MSEETREPQPLGPPHFCAWCRREFGDLATLNAHVDTAHPAEIAEARRVWAAIRAGASPEEAGADRLALRLVEPWLTPQDPADAADRLGRRMGV